MFATFTRPSRQASNICFTSFRTFSRKNKLHARNHICCKKTLNNISRHSEHEKSTYATWVNNRDTNKGTHLQHEEIALNSIQKIFAKGWQITFKKQHTHACSASKHTFCSTRNHRFHYSLSINYGGAIFFQLMLLGHQFDLPHPLPTPHTENGTTDTSIFKASSNSI
jgi:hypothetical protein